MKGRLYRDRAGKVRWRIVARNGRIVADSGQGYATPAGARRAFLRVLKAPLRAELYGEAMDAPVVLVPQREHAGGFGR